MKSVGAVALGFAVGVTVAITVFLVGNMFRSISAEKRKSRLQKTWKNFGLSLAFCILFFSSWVAQGVAEWQVYTDEQRTHRQPVEAGDFMAEFSQSTLENWQSEFLQLFSFVVMSALFIQAAPSPRTATRRSRRR
jgi:hypothetical protein